MADLPVRNKAWKQFSEGTVIQCAEVSTGHALSISNEAGVQPSRKDFKSESVKSPRGLCRCITYKISTMHKERMSPRIRTRSEKGRLGCVERNEDYPAVDKAKRIDSNI